jgi:RNA polymerase sigma-54 factor
MAALTAHLEYLAAGRLADLAAVARVPMAELPSLIGRLRGLNPKPGPAFDTGPTPLRSADLILRFDDTNGWVLERGTWLQPKLHITAPEGRAAAQAVSAVSRALRGFERRDRVIMDVARCVFDLQGDFMRGLRPAPAVVTRRQVAEVLGVHETTVGRVRQHLVVRFETDALTFAICFVVPFRLTVVTKPR